MKDRSFIEMMCGAIACLSMLGFYAIVKDAEPQLARTAPLDDRWRLPDRRRRRSLEDDCRHCAGSGECESCAPGTCRVCRGSGLHPRDESLLPRLDALWGRA